MLKILASQSGQILNQQSLSRETNLSLPTVQKYLSILEETYVIKLVSPFSKSPSVEITKNPKIFMYDSGLQSILWLDNFQSTLLGSVFETNVFGELAKKYGRNDIHFWRNKQQKEIDFIIELPNLKILPIEVKTNFAQFSKKSINTFLKKYKQSLASETGKQSLASETGKPEKWSVIGLEGEKSTLNMIYPWEI
jgi:predicted AAA+ superfamily ATPase